MDRTSLHCFALNEFKFFLTVKFLRKYFVQNKPSMNFET